eukprot:1175481-Amphidinium_carterae.2
MLDSRTDLIISNLPTIRVASARHIYKSTHGDRMHRLWAALLLARLRQIATFASLYATCAHGYFLRSPLTTPHLC